MTFYLGASTFIYIDKEIICSMLINYKYKAYSNNRNAKVNVLCGCQTIISYGIIFWGSASLAKSIRNAKENSQSNEIFKRMKMNTLYSHNIDLHIYMYLHYFCL